MGTQQEDVNSTSETQQEDVNSTSETQQVENSTTSVRRIGLTISFFDDSDDESDDEDNTCEPVQVDNVCNTPGRLPTIVEKDEEVDVQDEVPVEVPDENKSIVSEIPSTLESVRDTDTVGSSSSTNRSVPYVIFEETKVYFNQLNQRLIDGSSVEVLEYAGNNMVRCRAGKNLIICDPFEEFVNFRRFAELCNKKYIERKKKFAPKKEIVKKEIPKINLGTLVSDNKSFLSVVSKKDVVTTSSSSVDEENKEKDN